MELNTIKSSGLFRSQALTRSQCDSLGDVILITPVSSNFFALAALTAMVIFAVAMVGVTYSVRTPVQGTLRLVNGQETSHSLTEGIVTNLFVKEGDVVRAGDRLISLTKNRYSGDFAAQYDANLQLQNRVQLLQEQLATLNIRRQQDQEYFSEKVSNLSAKCGTISRQLESQQQILRISTDAVSRYQNLLAKGYISLDQLQSRQSDLLSQKQRQIALESDIVSCTSEKESALNEKKKSATDYEIKMLDIQKQLSILKDNIRDNNLSQSELVVATSSGVVSNMLVTKGQLITPAETLLNIIPNDSELVAVLYAPSTAIGFVAVGDNVVIRYDAYPYQKFGTFKGVVQQISKSPSSIGEIANVDKSFASKESPSYFIVHVSLPTQNINSKHNNYRLQPGMSLQADLLQPKQRLYEFLFAPLYSLSKRGN